MRLSLPESWVGYLIRRAMRTPYAHLPGYMERYWLVPYTKRHFENDGTGWVSWRRPIARLLQHIGIAIRVHHILRSDDARAFHDHPWWYCTVILRGGYTEVRPVFNYGMYEGAIRSFQRPGTVLFRRAKSWHRLEVRTGESAWTLFITGRYTNKWGFLVQPRFKQYWREYNAVPCVASAKQAGGT